MDVDLDRPHEDDTMEYEEEQPSTNIPIEADGTLEGVLKDDEVMDLGTTDTALQPNPDHVITIDGDVDFGDDEAGDGGVDEMEAEPTPIPGTSTGDPFFVSANATLTSGVGDGAGSDKGHGAEVEEQKQGENIKDAVLDDEDAKAGKKYKDQAGNNPLMAQSGGVLAEASIRDEEEVSGDNIAGPSRPAQSPQSHIDLADQTRQPDTADIGIHEGDEEYAEEEEEEYYEDEAETIAPEDKEAGAETAADQSAAHLEPADNPQPEETEVEEDEDTYDPDEMLTVHTLPAIILHLPDQPPKSLFFPLDPADGLPDGISSSTPIWFQDKHEKSAQVPLAELLQAIRRELEADQKGVRSGKEMLMEEKGLGLVLGDHDKHLAQVTLLEYLQVHHSCSLPTPVQFFITFHESKFWDRFTAIRKELISLAEKEKGGNANQGVNDGGDEDEMSEAGEDDTEGYASEEEGAEEVVPSNQRRAEGNDTKAEYGGSQIGEATADKREGKDNSAHPHADRANSLPTAPMAFGVGARATPNPKARTAASLDPPPREAEGAGLPAIENKGRSSGKEEADGDKADMTEASTTDSTTGAMYQDQIPQDYAEMHGSDSLRVLPEHTDDVIDDGDELEVFDPADDVPKDEIALKRETEAMQEATLEDEGDETVIQDGAVDLHNVDVSTMVPSPLGTPLGDVELGTPLGDVELGQKNLDVPITTPSILTSASSTDIPYTANGSSGVLTPATETPGASTVSREIPGSGLVNEIRADEEDTYFPPITEGDEAAEEEYEDEEDYEDDDEELGVDADKIIENYVDAKADEGEKPKEPLKLAVEKDLVSEKAAREAVGDEVWEAEYADDEGYIVGDNETQDTEIPLNPYTENSPASSATAGADGDDDVVDDEEYYEEEEDVEVEAPVRSAKRSERGDGDGEGDNEETASKKPRIPEPDAVRD